MLDYEYLLLKCVQIIKDGKLVNDVHNILVDQLKEIHRNNVLEMFCLILDELIIEKFFEKNKDISSLLEEKFFKTSYGGNHFFLKLRDFITDRDHEMLRICYLGIKIGFKGQYEQIPENIVEEIQNVLNIQDTRLVRTINFKPKTSQDKPYSFLYGISPIITMVVVIVVINYFLFRPLIPAIVKVSMGGK